MFGGIIIVPENFWSGYCQEVCYRYTLLTIILESLYARLVSKLDLSFPCTLWGGCIL